VCQDERRAVAPDDTADALPAVVVDERGEGSLNWLRLASSLLRKCAASFCDAVAHLELADKNDPGRHDAAQRGALRGVMDVGVSDRSGMLRSICGLTPAR
jgi:hypothetical protein